MLSERRAADRAKMADQLQAACEAAGATVTRDEPMSIWPRRVGLKISVPGGAYIGVDFDGDSCQPDVHVATWNVELDSDSCFSASLGLGVNEYHYRKCNVVVHGFEPLRDRLLLDIATLISGAGYSPTRTRQHAEKMLERDRSALTYYRDLAARGECEEFLYDWRPGTPENLRRLVDIDLPARITARQAFLREAARAA